MCATAILALSASTSQAQQTTEKVVGKSVVGGTGDAEYDDFVRGTSTPETLFGRSISRTQRAVPTIDTGQPVTLISCSPCHASIAEVNVPGLKFGHGLHVLVECSTCHVQMPHYDGKTDRVPMETCFACHGVEHGPAGEIATAACSKCHTSTFQLRPKSHTTKWSGKPHARKSNTAAKANDCMMCHNAAKDCDPCHAEKDIEVGPFPDTYHSVVPRPEKRPTAKIFAHAAPTISQCQHCHQDLDRPVQKGVIFAHEPHVSRNYSCESCHASFPHTTRGTAMPLMIECYRCHGVKHNEQGEVASEDCYFCHPRDFELVPRNHTPSFYTKTHGKRARAEIEYCRMCHSDTFCVPCHRGKGTTKWASKSMIIPDDHKESKWLKAHGAPYLKGEGLCGACHDGPSCQRCHKTVMPHPADFVSNHKPAPGVPNDDCNVCHSDRNSCQNCHHAQVKNAYLTEEACVGCHPTMKQKPATAIKHKAFSEHAVHFDVEKSKGKPYKCYECHFTFGQTGTGASINHGSTTAGNLQQGHDLQLCYTCHGALDPLNEPIAPYPGGGLCLRCHKDLNMF